MPLPHCQPGPAALHLSVVHEHTLHWHWRSITPAAPPPPSPLQDKLFKSYIEMELQLGNIERCRTLYQKYIEWAPANAGAWGRWVGGGARVQGGRRLGAGAWVCGSPQHGCSAPSPQLLWSPTTHIAIVPCRLSPQVC